MFYFCFSMRLKLPLVTCVSAVLVDSLLFFLTKPQNTFIFLKNFIFYEPPIVPSPLRFIFVLAVNTILPFFSQFKYSVQDITWLVIFIFSFNFLLF